MKKLKAFWKKITIKNKITLFTGTVFLTILVAIVFDAILIRLFVIDVNDIMEDNSKGGEIVAVLDKEKDCFNAYIDNNSLENREALLNSFRRLRQ